MSRVGSNLAAITTLKTTQCNIPRNQRISKITIHHVAGVINGANLQGWGRNPSCGVSWHYGIGNDGVIGQLIDERNRPWTSSNGNNDNKAITLEVANSKTAPSWEIGQKAWAAMLNLLVDICKRNPGIKQKNGQVGLYFDGTPNASLTIHKLFSNTNCPGPYIEARLQAICNEVNKRLGTAAAKSATSVNQTTSAKSATSAASAKSAATDFKVGDVVEFIGGGVYMSSTTSASAHSRDKSRCRVTRTAMKARNQYHLVSEDKGGVHGWVLSEHIKAIGGAVSTSSKSTAASSKSTSNSAKPASNSAKSSKKSVDEIAREVMRGNWGNGDDRVKRLTAAGYDAKAVQARVNQLLK